MLLAGDVGGTKTRLAIYSSLDGLQTPLKEGTLPSTHYASLEDLVLDFLGQSEFPLERASFGVAGPVVAGKAKITNLPWTLDERHLQEELHIPAVTLLNDLVATAHAIPFLLPQDLHTLNEGRPVPHGTLAVIAPGTGLGEAFLTWDGTGYRTFASEGGHTDFAPTNDLEIELLRYLLERFDHVSYELVCSGIGMPNIYAFFKDVMQMEESALVASSLQIAEDATPIIARSALDPTSPSPCSVATLETFVSILGAEAGNLVLKVLATGGIYIGGGIPPRILPFLRKERFLQAFRHKGRFASMLADIPVHVITNPRPGLLGAAYHGLSL